MKIVWAVFIWCWNVTDGRTDRGTDRRTDLLYQYRASVCWRAIKNYMTRNTLCRTRNLSNATFSFLITWRSSSSKSAVVYKISWKSDDLSLSYGDITTFKMAAVRHLKIVLPPYETTHEVSVAGCSCLSNFISIWYTDLKI